MSFLRNHLRHFVLPGIHTLAKRQGRGGHSGNISGGSGLTEADIKPRDKQLRPSTKCKYAEAGMLYSLISSVLRKGDPTREVALGLCRQIGRAKDAEFVYEIDSRGGVKGLGDGYDGVEGSDVLHSMLCNSTRRLKRKMRRRGTLLLPGRDVWCWEVLARKLSVQSTYDPRVSRSVAGSQKALKTCIDDWKVKTWDDILFFDTGFAGSIPKAIGRAVGLDEINMLLLSHSAGTKQIFRTHTGSRKKALAFEYLAKYRLRGTHRDGTPYQELSSLDEFIKAALLTIWLWYHVSPTKLPSYRDKKKMRGQFSDFDKKAGIAYKNSTIDPANQGTLTFAGNNTWASNDLVSVQPMMNTLWDTTTGGIGYQSSATTTGNVSFYDSSATSSTLDHLWGAGATQQILVDQMQPPQHGLGGPPKTILDEMKQEIDKEVISKLLKSVGGNTDKIPVDKIPPSQLYEQVPLIPAKSFSPSPKSLKPLVVNPETMELCDANTGQSIEKQMDAKALAVFKGQQNPTEEGFGIGQYPGPPVIKAQALKSLAGANPYGPLPDVSLSIEIENGQAIKKTVFKTPLPNHLQPGQQGKPIQQTKFI